MEIYALVLDALDEDARSWYYIRVRREEVTEAYS
jgi:hypothetical protein